MHIPGPPFWLISATIGVKVVAYASMVRSFWRWRRQSVVRVVCMALVINFAVGDLMTAARFADRFLPITSLVDWLEITAALISALCARFVWVGVHR